MPLFLDRHHVPGVTLEAVANAHKLDVDAQEAYQVRYVTYWFDDQTGVVNCLAEGPDREALSEVHRRAHGLVADNVIEVGEGPVQAFLGPPPAHDVGEAYVESAVRAIVFTDICDSTQQTAALGDERFMVLLRSHDDTVRGSVRRRGGREVKHTGDGIMSSFTSVTAAVESAIEIQRELATRNETAEHALHVRIGISVGEPVTEHDDLFGAAVQLSARLCSIAPPGGIAVSNVVRELCVGKAFDFEGPVERMLKGFPVPVSVFDVRF